MKNLFIAFALCVMVMSCDAPKTPQLFNVEDFTTDVEGKEVSLYTLKAGELVMQVTNFGARVVSLWTPDKEGDYEDVVLGYNNIDSYINNSGERFLCAVVGPYANRIADDTSLVLAYTHKDGQEGMPGNLEIFMTYTLTKDNEFKVEYMAQTDKPTHVNISHHSFFNLKGEGNGTINDHVLCINASHTTPVNEVFIPSGEVADVTGTPFDFRQPKAIEKDLYAEDEQVKNGSGYDHNWVLDRQTPDQVELAATVYEPASGRFMEVLTDQTALQFYGGNFFNGKTIGKYGKALKYRESIALETQKYPDTPNHSNFPSTLLNPGEEYTHTCVYRFSVR